MTMPDEAVFADLGLDQAPDDPNEIPDGVYKAVVDNIKMYTHPNKEEGKNRFCIITYKIIDDEYPAVKDNTVDEWKSANKGDSTKQKAFLKSRFLSLGVPKPDVDAGRINFKSLFGLPVQIKVKSNNGFTNINDLKLLEGQKTWTDSGEGPTSNSVPAQPAAGSLDF